MTTILLSTILFFLTFLSPASGAPEDLTLTVIYDNNPYRKGLEARWGFSCLVEGTEKSILFDVGGNSRVLLNNMAMLNIDPGAVDIVVLSHIHGDHIGGLPGFLERNPDVVVYMPDSFPFGFKNAVKDAGAKPVGVKEPSEITRNVFSTGELGTWIKEESLVIETTKGLIVITGCAHPGIVNIVKKAKAMVAPAGDVYMVLGGFHLIGMHESQVRRIAHELKREGVRKVAPSHCSGDLCRRIFRRVYASDCILLGAGKRIVVREAIQATGIDTD